MPRRLLWLLAVSSSVGSLVGTAVTVAATDPATGYAVAALEEPAQFFTRLVERYRALVEYSDSVMLAQRTIEAGGESTDAFNPTIPGPPRVGVSWPAPRTSPWHGSSIEQRLDCLVRGSTLAVTSSAIASSHACDADDRSAVSRLRLAKQLWTLPHLALRFADEPLRSLDGAGGALIPTRIDEVLVGGRSYLRLHLTRADEAPESAPPDATAPSESEEESASSVDLFVNPRSMLVERIEHRRTIGEGVRYEATIDITPDRAIARDDVAATETRTPQAPLVAPDLESAEDPRLEGERPVTAPQAAPEAPPVPPLGHTPAGQLPIAPQ